MKELEELKIENDVLKSSLDDANITDANQARNKPRKWRYKTLNEDYDKFQVKKSSSKHPTSITSQMSKSRKLGDEFGKSFMHGRSKEDRPYLKADYRPATLTIEGRRC